MQMLKAVNAGTRKGERMQKSVSLLCAVLILFLMLIPAGCAGGENVDTLTGWNIRIDVPEGATAVLEGNEYYIFSMQSQAFPVCNWEHKSRTVLFRYWFLICRSF